MTKPDQTNPKNKTPENRDPHQKREAEKYDNPIVSREFILAHLDTQKNALTHPELVEQLNLTDPDSIEALRRRLIAMSRDGQLVGNRKGQYMPASMVTMMKGLVIGHRDGFGFVKLDEGGNDLYLSARQMRTVFDGDRVLVRADREDHRGKKHAIIVDILERNTSSLVGRIYHEGNTTYVEVENNRICQHISIEPENSGRADHGQYVEVEIIHQPTKRTLATGKVTDVLGDHLAPGMEIDVAIRAHAIPFIWPADVEYAVKKLKPKVSEPDKENRIDVRHLPLVTIDGEDARDFDDAVYCEQQKEGWKLYVAIADVSHYVRADEALDKEANNRATSVYFPDHVVPMLPEVLSNGLCSLNPKVDRLCMVCEMDINKAGDVTASQFYEGVMHSHARLTYNQVGAMLEQPESDDAIQLSEDFAEVLPHLQQLYTLYGVLQAKRKERGAIDFDTVETRIIFDENRKIDAIVPTIRNDAHKIIEECMLCANVATAQFLVRHKLPVLYRTHDGPSQEKLENVRSFLGEQGLQLMGGDTPEPSDYQAIIAQIKDRPDFRVLQTILLRSMSQAVYEPEEKGHFGLAFKHYAHFTSPIRRYPDLLVHRAIKSVIYSKKECVDVKRPEGLDLALHNYPYDLAKMLVLGEQCSMAERRADEATRDVHSWLKCEYLQQHVGETFEGLISAVTGFGFFVELADLYVEGLVHISTLNGDYFNHDVQKHRLVGERSGARYGLGDKVVVQVSQINLEERKVDLMLIGSEGAKAGKSRSRRPEKNSKNTKGAKKDYRKGSKKNSKASDKKPFKKKVAKASKPIARGEPKSPGIVVGKEGETAVKKVRQPSKRRVKPSVSTEDKTIEKTKSRAKPKVAKAAKKKPSNTENGTKKISSTRKRKVKKV